MVYFLKMEEGMTMADHLNLFNMIITQLTSIGVSISEERCWLILLSSLPNSWDHFVMVIGYTTTQLMMDKVLLNPTKGTIESTQIRSLFKTMCKSKEECYKVVFDSRGNESIVSLEMVE